MEETTITQAWNYIETNLNWLLLACPNSKTLNRLRGIAENTLKNTKANNQVDVRTHIKQAQQERHLKELIQKPLQCNFEKAVAKDQIAIEESRNWMARTQMSKTDEKIVFAIRNQTLPLRGIKSKIWKLPGPTVCRICQEQTETVDHILSGCGKLGFTDYLHRHNSVAKTIVAATLRSHGREFHRHWWKHQVPRCTPLDNSGESFIQWEPTIPTTVKLDHNKPDLHLKLPTGKHLLIEVTVCRDDLVADRTEKKAQKYMELRDNVAAQWGKHVQVLPIAIGVTGVISKQTLHSVRVLNRCGINLHPSALQKTAAVGSAKIVRRVLSLH